jgi:hypothetical protein
LYQNPLAGPKNVPGTGNGIRPNNKKKKSTFRPNLMRQLNGIGTSKRAQIS